MRRIRLRLYSRSGWWWLDIRVDGRRVAREPTGTKLRREAELYLDRRRAELGDPTYSPGPRAAWSVTSAVADFRLHGLGGVADGTATMYRSKAGHAVRLLGTLDVGALSRDDVVRYIKTRTDEGAKPHTVSKELTTLRRVLAWAEQQKHLEPGWAGIFPEFSPAYAPRERWLTEDEYLIILAACEPERRLFVTVLVFTGARLSEASRLTWADVDFKTKFVRIQTAKVRKGKPPKVRRIPMAPELRRSLLRARGDGAVGPLFPDRWANPALMLSRIARKAAIVGPKETLNNNDMRRTFASWMLQRGAQVREVAELLGHGSIQMVEKVYGHLAKQNLIDAVGRLPSFKDRK
jgi:integrase